MNRTVIINDESNITFSNIPIGAIFTWGSEVYMKISAVFDEETDHCYNSVKLDNGNLYDFDDDDSLTDNFRYFPNIKEIIMR